MSKGQGLLGMIGAVIGALLAPATFGLTGLMIGMTIGSTIGGLIDPPKIDFGEDPEINSSPTYGFGGGRTLEGAEAPIPFQYGKVRVFGNIVNKYVSGYDDAGNQKLAVKWVVGEGLIERIDNVRINDLSWGELGGDATKEFFNGDVFDTSTATAPVGARGWKQTAVGGILYGGRGAGASNDRESQFIQTQIPEEHAGANIQTFSTSKDNVTFLKTGFRHSGLIDATNNAENAGYLRYGLEIKPSGYSSNSFFPIIDVAVVGVTDYVSGILVDANFPEAGFVNTQARHIEFTTHLAYDNVNILPNTNQWVGLNILAQPDGWGVWAKYTATTPQAYDYVKMWVTTSAGANSYGVTFPEYLLGVGATHFIPASKSPPIPADTEDHYKLWFSFTNSTYYPGDGHVKMTDLQIAPIFKYVTDKTYASKYWEDTVPMIPVMKPDRYDIRVTNAKSTSDVLDKDDMSVEYITEFYNRRSPWLGVAGMDMYFTANERLSGGGLNISGEAYKVIPTFPTSASFPDSPQKQFDSNPAWCILDFLTNSIYGKNISPTKINIGSFIEVASYCVANSFACNYIVDRRVEDQRILNDMLMSFGGYINDYTGEILLHPDTTVSSWTQEFDLENIVEGSLTYSELPYNKQTNYLKVQYFDSSYGDRKHFLITDDADIATKSDRIEGEVQLLAVDNLAQAKKIGQKLWNYSKLSNKIVNFKTTEEAVGCEPGDVVMISHPLMGWGYTPEMHKTSSGQLYRIVGMKKEAKGDVGIVARNYDSNVYVESAYVISPGDTPYPTLYLPPPPVPAGSINANETTVMAPDGHWRSDILLTWQQGSVSDVSSYSATAKYAVQHAVGTPGNFFLDSWAVSPYLKMQDVPVGVDHFFRIIPYSDRNISNTRSVTQVSIHTSGHVIGSTFDNVGGFTLVFSKNNLLASWTVVSRADLKGYEVRSSDSGWGTGGAIFSGLANQFSIPDVTYRSWSLALKAFDNLGNYSATPALASVTNSPPSLSGVTPVIGTGFKTIWVSWTSAGDDDLKEYAVLADTNNPPTTEVARVVGTDAHITGVYSGVYIEVAPYDGLGIGTPSNVVVGTPDIVAVGTGEIDYWNIASKAIREQHMDDASVAFSAIKDGSIARQHMESNVNDLIQNFTITGTIYNWSYHGTGAGTPTLEMMAARSAYGLSFVNSDGVYLTSSYFRIDQNAVYKFGFEATRTGSGTTEGRVTFYDKDFNVVFPSFYNVASRIKQADYNYLLFAAKPNSHDLLQFYSYACGTLNNINDLPEPQNYDWLWKFPPSAVWGMYLIGNFINVGMVNSMTVFNPYVIETDYHVVGANQLVDGAVIEAKIASDAVSAVKLKQFAVGSDKIAWSAVLSGHMATGAVVADNIAAKNIFTEHLSVGAIDLMPNFTKTQTMKSWSENYNAVATLTQISDVNTAWGLVVATSGHAQFFTSSLIPIDSGISYKYTMTYRKTGTSGGIYVRVIPYDENINVLEMHHIHVDSRTLVSTAGTSVDFASDVQSTGYFDLEGYILGAGADYRDVPRGNAPEGQFGGMIHKTRYLRFDLFSWNNTEVNTAVFINPTLTPVGAGAIYAGQIESDQIKANHIVTNAISASHISAGAIYGDKIAGGSIYGEHLYVGAFDYLQNPTKTQTTDGWSFAYGQVPTIEDADGKTGAFGVPPKALTVAGSNIAFSSSWTQIDASASYKVTAQIKANGTTGYTYMGFYVYDRSWNTLPVEYADTRSRTTIGSSTNLYFMSQAGSHDWITCEGYFIGAGNDWKSAPEQYPLQTNFGKLFRFPEDAYYFLVRGYARYNATAVETGQIYSPTMVKFGAGKIMASQIEADQILAEHIIADAVDANHIKSNIQFTKKMYVGEDVLILDARSRQMIAVDSQGVARAKFGEYETGKYGFTAYNASGDKTIEAGEILYAKKLKLDEFATFRWTQRPLHLNMLQHLDPVFDPSGPFMFVNTAHYRSNNVAFVGREKIIDNMEHAVVWQSSHSVQTNLYLNRHRCAYNSNGWDISASSKDTNWRIITLGANYSEVHLGSVAPEEVYGTVKMATGSWYVFRDDGVTQKVELVPSAVDRIYPLQHSNGYWFIAYTASFKTSLNQFNSDLTTVSNSLSISNSHGLGVTEESVPGGHYHYDATSPFLVVGYVNHYDNNWNPNKLRLTKFSLYDNPPTITATKEYTTGARMLNPVFSRNTVFYRAESLFTAQSLNYYQPWVMVSFDPTTLSILDESLFSTEVHDKLHAYTGLGDLVAMFRVTSFSDEERWSKYGYGYKIDGTQVPLGGSGYST